MRDPSSPAADREPSHVDERQLQREQAAGKRREQQQPRDAAPQGRRAPDREEA